MLLLRHSYACRSINESIEGLGHSTHKPEKLVVKKMQFFSLGNQRILIIRVLKNEYGLGFLSRKVRLKKTIKTVQISLPRPKQLNKNWRR